MRLRYKFGLAAGFAYIAYVIIYGAILGAHPLVLLLVAVLVVGSGIPAVLATSWLFDRLVSNKIRAARAPPRLVFFHTSGSSVGALRQAFGGHPQFTASVAKPGQLTGQQRGLDALYVSLTDAVERWGARPASHKSQVLRTRPEDSGMPPYVVTGVTIGADERRAGDASYELKLTMTAVLDAVKSFNAENSPPIRTVGFWADALGMDRLDLAEAASIVVSVSEPFVRATNPM
jgi:hypothetical protein